MTSTARLAAASFLLAVLFAPAAEAFRLQRTPGGLPVRWDDGDIPVRVLFHTRGSDDVGPETTHRTWLAALASWENVSCSDMRFNVAGTTSARDPIAGDGVTVFMFLEDRWLQGADNALAVTIPVHDRVNGLIYDADVLFNGVHYRWAVDGRADRIDLQAVSTHEFGHAVGIDHPCEYGGQDGAPTAAATATGRCEIIAEYYYTSMFPSTDAGNTLQRQISDDDAMAICSVYSSGRPHMPRPRGDLGAPCEGPLDCNSRICISTSSGGGICTETCLLECVEGYDCRPFQDGTSVCVPATEDTRRTFGQACTLNSECRSNRCVEDGSGGQFCSQTCQDDNGCPGGYVCSGGLCRLPQQSTPPGTGQVGASCQSERDCAQGLSCVSDNGRRYCTSSCQVDNQCNTGFECISNLCVFTLPDGLVGDACTSHEECLSGSCIADGETMYCSQECGTDPDCPPGFICFTAGESGVCATAPAAPTVPPPAQMNNDGGGGGCSQAPARRPSTREGLLGLLALVCLMGIPILARRS